MGKYSEEQISVCDSREKVRLRGLRMEVLVLVQVLQVQVSAPTSERAAGFRMCVDLRTASEGTCYTWSKYGELMDM